MLSLKTQQAWRDLSSLTELTLAWDRRVPKGAGSLQNTTGPLQDFSIQGPILENESSKMTID